MDCKECIHYDVCEPREYLVNIKPENCLDFKPLATGCKYCTEYADLPEYVEDGEPRGRAFGTCIEYDNLDGLGWFITGPWDVDIGIKFCPYCGRELPKGEE